MSTVPHVDDLRRTTTRGEVWRLTPALLVLALVLLAPLVWTAWLSLHDVRAGGGRTFVGIDNYAAVLGSRSWWTAALTTGVVMAGLTVAQLALALPFAVALWHVTVLWRPARFLALVPAGVGAVVGAHAGRTAVDGGFLATWFGPEMAGPWTELVGVVLGELWRTTGLVVLLVYIGLTRVPVTLLDAAVADGATPWQRWRRVIWPVLSPVLVLIVIFRALDAWRLLDGPLLVRDTGDFGTTVSAVVADNAFAVFHTGPAAAGGVVTVVLALVVVGVVYGLARLVRLR